MEETKEYLLKNWEKFDTCIPYFNPTTLIEEGNRLYIKYLPNCFDCYHGCENNESYDDCTSQKPIIINSDGTINFKDYKNIDKKSFVEHFSSYF